MTTYAEFFVTQEGSAADINGGGPRRNGTGGAIYQCPTCTSDGTGEYITDNDLSWDDCQVGDWMCFDSGGAKEFAEILDITSNVAQVWPVVTHTVAGVEARVGGAWADLSVASARMSVDFRSFAGALPRLNIHADSTWSDLVACANDGTYAFPISFQGFADTPGDGGVAEIDGTGAATYAAELTGDYHVLRDVHLNCGSKSGLYFNGARGFAERVDVTCSGTTGLRDNAGAALFLDCDVVTTGSYGIYCDATSTRVVGCTVSGGTQCGIRANYSTVIACVAENAAHGLWGYGQTLVNGCVFYGNSGDGMRVNSGFCEVLNSIAYGNGGYGFNGNALEIRGDFCATGNNSSGPYNDELPGSFENNIPLSADPFVDAANGDFTLNNTAGAGLSCQETGYPAYLDIGSKQSKGVDHADLHLVKALVCNKKSETLATGVTIVYDDDGTTPMLTITPSEASGVITLTPSGEDTGTPGTVATELQQIKATLANKKQITISTGAVVVKDDDGSTTLLTLTPSTASGVKTVTPS